MRCHSVREAAMILLLCAACSSNSGAAVPSSTSTAATGPRPASPAKLSIVSPKNGQVIHGASVTLRVSLKGARLVRPTTTHIVPTQGHLHVILDDKLISMTSGTTQVIHDVTAGQHLIKVEFVASDHLPFNPRVIAAVAFEVKP